LINDILDLAKIESGKVEVDVAPVDVADLLETKRGHFEPMAREKGLRFAIELAADAPTSIETDRQRLQQILRNLLSNAIKFTHAGEVVLRVESVQDDRIALSVSDTGIGIAEDQQQAVKIAHKTWRNSFVEIRAETTTTLYLVLQRQTELITARGRELQSQTDLNRAISIFNRATGSTLTINNVTVSGGTQLDKK